MRMSGNFTKKYEGLSKKVKVLDLKVRVYFEEAEKRVYDLTILMPINNGGSAYMEIFGFPQM
jgi:hypothetical protein